MTKKKMTQNFTKSRSAPLLAWYKRNKRDLPWRKNKDPYRIWISEIMLQQTRVEAVIPYYQKFLQRFTDVGALAKASEDEVRAYWAGLGYYSRAMNLHKAAQKIIKDFGRKFPNNYDSLLELPGVGPYTASAISSIAFAERRAAIDGNLERVLARVLGLRESPKSADGYAKIQALAEQLILDTHAGDVNEALMDLSSTTCAVKNPRCILCPFQKKCIALKEGLTDQIPLKREKKKVIELLSRSAVIFRKNKSNIEVLLLKRNKNEWLSGMWDIPWWIEKEENRLAESIQNFTNKKTLKKLGDFQNKRTITHHKIITNNEFFSLEKGKKQLEAWLHSRNFSFQWKCTAEELQLPNASKTALRRALSFY